MTLTRLSITSAWCSDHINSRSPDSTNKRASLWLPDRLILQHVRQDGCSLEITALHGWARTRWTQHALSGYLPHTMSIRQKLPHCAATLKVLYFINELYMNDIQKLLGRVSVAMIINAAHNELSTGGQWSTVHIWTAVSETVLCINKQWAD